MTAPAARPALGQEVLARAVFRRPDWRDSPLFWKALSVVVVIVAWELYGRFGGNPLFPPLTRVLEAWVQLASDGTLARALSISAQAFAIGFPAAVIVGLWLGLLMGTSEDAEHLLSPYVNALIALPSIAYIPLIMIWFGIDLTARIIIVFEYAVLIIAINTMTGVKMVDRTLVEMGRSLCMPRREIFRQIVIPAAVPGIVAGLRLGLGRGIKGTINAEMLMVLVGLGGMIMRYSAGFRLDFTLALVLTVVAIGLVAAIALDRMEHHVTKWRGAA